jgi:hypothetical protein
MFSSLVWPIVITLSECTRRTGTACFSIHVTFAYCLRTLVVVVAVKCSVNNGQKYYF